ncbi:MAG: DUF748 domain-containing protein [Phycisphaerae bacterium]
MTDDPKSPEVSTSDSNKSRRSARFAVIRRRSVWVIFITAAVLLLLRLSLIFVFPAVLEHVLADYTLTAAYSDIKLDVLGGDAEIWGLKVRPLKGGPDVMTVEYCHGNISVYKLFVGQLFIRRAVADGADVFLRRRANGSCPLLKAILSHSAGTTVSPSDNSGNKTAISLAAPLRVEAFRLEHLRLHVIDHSVQPTVRLNITMNVRVSHLGRRHGATAFRLDLWSSAVVDVLHIDGSLTTGPSALLATSHILMRGLRLQPATGYLTALGFNPQSEGLSLSAESTLALHVITSNPTGRQEISAQFALKHFILSSGGRPALAIQSLLANGRLAGNLADVQTLSLNGVTLNAGRGKNGLLHFAGMELLRHMTTGSKRLAAAAAALQAVKRAPLHLPGLPKVQLKTAGSYTYSIDRLELNDFNAVFRDAAVTPHTRLQLTLNTLDAVSTGGLPGSPGQKLTISGSGAAPGIAGAIDISGSMLPFAHTRTLALHLAASQITCNALAAYLSAAGLKSEVQSARFNVDLSGSVTTVSNGTLTANIHLDHLNYRDGKTTLCDFKHIDAGKVRVNASTGRLEIGTLNVVGPAFDFVREPSGYFSVLGLEIVGKHSLISPMNAAAAIKPAAKIAQTVPPATMPKPVATAYLPPRLQIDYFKWSGIRIGFDDQHAMPATRIAISHAGLMLNHFILDLSGKSAAHGAGTLKAWLQAPGVIDRFDLHGTLEPGKNSLQTRLGILSTGIDLRRLTPYLKPLGILPLLRHGSFTGLLAAHVALLHGKISGGVRVKNLQLRQDSQSLASIQQLAISHISARQGQCAIQSVLINKPYLHLSRLANGNLTLCGLELLPPAHGNINSGHPTPTQNAATPWRAAVKSITLSHAIVQWMDLAVFRPVNERIHAQARIYNVIFGHRHPTGGTLQAVLSAKALVDALNIHGSFVMPLHALAANIHLQATGLHGQVINSYLPQGIAYIPGGDNMGVSLHVHVSHLADGSATGTLGISNLNIIRPATASAPHKLLWVSRAAIALRQFDLPRHIVAIQSINADLQTLHINRQGGGWSIGGLNFGKYLNSKPPITGPMPATKPATGTFSIVPAPLPLITLTRLDLHAKDIELTGLLPGNHPFHVTAVDLCNTAPISCLGTAPARSAAIALQLTARVNGMARNVNMAYHLKPFASNPRAKLHVVISGIRGAGLAREFPALAKHFNVNTLTNGQFSADGALQLHMDRRSPIAFNFHRQFMASVKISHVAFAAEPHGPILAGVAEVDAEKINVQPSRSAITIALLNIRTPVFRLTHDAAGLHILGMTLKSASGNSPASAPKASQSTAQKTKINVTIKTVRTSSTQAGKPPANVEKVIKVSIKKPATLQPPARRVVASHHQLPAILIKRLIVGGIHAQYIDRTTTPNICIPLTALEAQVLNLGTVPLMKHIPVRFNVIAYAGAVRTLHSLPKADASRTGKSDQVLPVAMIQDLVHQKGGAKKALFSQLAANGQLYMYPHLQGWSTLSLNGLYLADLAPLAKEYGMTLTGGTFDSSSDLRFHANNHVDLHTKLVFSNLNISEPAHGPLAKLLNLPAPLNVAIAAIQAPDGSITIPISVPINGDAFSRSAVTGQVFGNMAQVVALGIASSPLKLANGLAGLFGSGKLKAVKEPPVKLAFSPGSTALTLQDWSMLRALGRRLRRHDSLQVIVRQTISTADVAIAALRANPSRNECLQMIAALKNRQNRLLLQRRQQVGALRGDLAIRLSRAAINAGTARLAELDSKIARTQVALNYLADMLAPGAARQSARRTRGTMITIARKRLSEIQAALFAAGFDHPNRRVYIVFPQYSAVKSATGGNALLTLVRTK